MEVATKRLPGRPRVLKTKKNREYNIARCLLPYNLEMRLSKRKMVHLSICTVAFVAASQGKLWEFIRDLLRNRETCPSLICWEDYSQAKFRFVKSDEVAKRWGSRKGNTKMTYEKLSRAMR